jgi:hypothetical protein
MKDGRFARRHAAVAGCDMPKNQRERRGVKDEELPRESTEAFSRRYQVLLFLSWLKVTSGPKKRKDGSWNWLRHAKYAAWTVKSRLWQL